MTREYLQKLLDSGEGFTIEYKKCVNRISDSVYETVCSFSNRYGGHILLGVEEAEQNGQSIGRVIGVNKEKVYDIKRNFITSLNDYKKFSPTLYLNLEEFDYDGMTVLWVYVPPTSGVCKCVDRVYDRNEDSDQDITDIPIRIQDLYNRKSTEYFEKKIFPYATKEHLMLELLDNVRKLVKKNNSNGNHPWLDMDDMEIMRSAGLYETDIETGKEGFNLAAILLFGKPEVIQSCSPGYRTDAIFRKENVDRYDDRIIVEDNLILAYDKLMDFAMKHMDDRFALDGSERVDARSYIAREVISNILIHRDYTSAFPAKLVIENDMLHTENWNKSRFDGNLDISKFEPYPKNPILARFFINIGRADTLGSGMRNLYKYTNLYSGGEPALHEGDVFTIDVPLYMNDNNKDSCSSKTANVGEKINDVGENVNDVGKNVGKNVGDMKKNILEIIRDDTRISVSQIAKKFNVTKRTIERHIKELRDEGVLIRHGSARGGYWEIKQ